MATCSVVPFSTEELKQRRLKLARERIRSGTWEMDLRSGKVIASPGVAVLSGLEPVEGPGSFVVYWRAIHPDDRARVRAALRDAMTKREAFQLAYRQRVLGRVSWTFSRGEVVLDEHGKPSHLVGVSMDLRHLVAEGSLLSRLGFARDRLELALSVGKMATWETTTPGLVMEVSANHGRLYGRETNFPVWNYDNFLDHVHPEDRERVTRELRTARESGIRSCSLEFRTIWPDGSVHWLSSRSQVVEGSATDPVRIRGAVIDVTDLKQAQAELEKALRIRDDFMSVASHELKTPLTALIMQIELLNRSMQNIEENGLVPVHSLERHVEGLTGSVNRLHALVDDLLDVTRIQAGKLILEPEPVDLYAMIHDIAGRFGPQLAAAGCTLRIDARSEAIGFWDVIRIEQVIENLLSNAIKYAPGSPITVTIGREDETGMAELSVQDEGPGIPKDKQEAVFDRFERLFSSTRVGGLGLGLFIVRRIVEGHGGSIRIESEPGCGSRFVVRLPLTPALEGQAPEREQGNGPRGASSLTK